MRAAIRNPLSKTATYGLVAAGLVGAGALLYAATRPAKAATKKTNGKPKEPPKPTDEPFPKQELVWDDTQESIDGSTVLARVTRVVSPSGGVVYQARVEYLPTPPNLPKPPKSDVFETLEAAVVWVREVYPDFGVFPEEEEPTA